MATILVVDDDPAARKPLVRLLQGHGYTVVPAADATIALAAATADTQPHLILLDVALPPLDGLTMLWRLRDTSAGRGIPVIVVTGHDDPETMRRARDLGVKDYLIKSRYKPADLLDLIKLYVGAPLPPAADPGSDESPSPSPTRADA